MQTDTSHTRPNHTTHVCTAHNNTTLTPSGFPQNGYSRYDGATQHTPKQQNIARNNPRRLPAPWTITAQRTLTIFLRLREQHLSFSSTIATGPHKFQVTEFVFPSDGKSIVSRKMTHRKNVTSQGSRTQQNDVMERRKGVCVVNEILYTRK